MSDVSRRAFMHVAGVAAMAVGTTPSISASPTANSARTAGQVKVVSSANGLEATKLAYRMIVDGHDPADAVVAGVAIVEDDPNDTSVGYGGLPNERGIVELDAAVMHGPTHRAGAVASLQNIRHPAQVALKVMRRSDHVLLVGAGARDFAVAHGFPEENLLTDLTRKIWLRWKETLSEQDDWLPDPNEADIPVAEFFRRNSKRFSSQQKSDKQGVIADLPRMKFRRPTGTIHCAGMTSSGDFACTTTTSGLAFKIPGRVGDSPVIGAGLYCDNEVGSCGSTGRGEANLQNLCSFAAVELMRHGASPEEAGMEVLRRVAKTAEPRLRDKDGRPDFGLSFYLLARDGRHAGVTMWGPQKFSVTDENGTRHEDCTALYTRNPSA
ncbi:MAG: N(4)-(beta-N-acetylglucosaminyl)-L-asparaginase [Planctomycetota bacterium]|nr:N(4)-(beta-N-acetylglucosaminyl)-L-asparaginase [Planctomycetota bacterium]